MFKKIFFAIFFGFVITCNINAISIVSSPFATTSNYALDSERLNGQLGAFYQNANNINGELIQQSLDYIEYSVNMITSAGPVNSLYEDLKGAKKGTENKKRLFDTKV